ncbi:MAG: Fic family protein, partial [Patescibacteria group bacterium]
MKIPPKYELTSKSVYLLTQIEANKAIFENTKIPEKVIENLTRQSLLKSSLYSAKIEGNSLVLEEAQNLQKFDSRLQERIEIENILSAFSYMKARGSKMSIDLALILKLHSLVMKGLGPNDKIGRIRTVPTAIFNQAGIAIYVAPPPSELTNLLKNLLAFINQESDVLTLVKATLSHFMFEKIHPFEDGNGRVGRLLLQIILAKGNYHFDYLLSFEEILNKKKSEYYDLLDRNQVSLFIEFMLEIIFEKLEELKKDILSKSNFTQEDALLPRRREILEIVRDHAEISLDSIQRRFLKIP